MNVSEKLLFSEAQNEVLFGKFSVKLSRENKLEAWKKVVDGLRSHGVPTALEKPVVIFRDTVWQTYL